MYKYSFSGHETFHCRNYWIKKGLDHIWAGETFNDQAVISLGVGKNMVNSIRFWLKSFGLIDDKNRPILLAEKIFRDGGGDPFMEDIGTVWLMHYLLITSGTSATYHLFFNEFRKQRLEFNRDQFLTYLENKCIAADVNYHLKSLKKDIGVFMNNYAKAEKSKGIEDDFAGLLYELELIQRVEKFGHVQWYKVENKVRPEIPAEIILFCILTNEKYGSSISFNELLNDINSVGSVFALNSSGLLAKIEQMIKRYKKYMTFSDNSGVRLLQFKKELNPMDVLNDYYGI